MHKILIVGSNGHIGSFLNSQLNNNQRVSLISLSDSIIKKNFTKVDLTDKNEVDNYVKKCDHFDVMIFLVGLAHFKGGKKDIKIHRKVNFKTLFNLLNSFKFKKKIPKKIIYASTISIYGEGYDCSEYIEEAKKMPASPYAITKLEAEEYLLKNFKNRTWILRLAPVYSKEFQLNINRRTRFLGIPFKVGSGEVQFSLCNIKNIFISVQGVINNKVPKGVYNISDRKEYSYIEILKWKKIKFYFPFPYLILKIVYVYGKSLNNIFLKENSLKLLKSNIYSSKKINKYINLKNTIFDVG